MSTIEEAQNRISLLYQPRDNRNPVNVSSKGRETVRGEREREREREWVSERESETDRQTDRQIERTSLSFSETLLNCFLRTSDPLLVSASIDSCEDGPKQFNRCTPHSIPRVANKIRPTFQLSILHKIFAIFTVLDRCQRPFIGS